MENKEERFNQMKHLLSVSRKQRWMGLLLHHWPFDRGTSALSWSFQRRQWLYRKNQWQYQRTDDTSFYLNQNGEVVICFNEGDVAPMYMSCVEFVIPNEVLADIRK